MGYNKRYRIPKEISMTRIGPTELIIILVIVLLLFGVGRIGKIAGELGSGIRSFREGLQGDGEKKESTGDKPSSSDDSSSKNA
jgi:sec-independent protein translocase protein TatA